MKKKIVSLLIAVSLFGSVFIPASAETPETVYSKVVFQNSFNENSLDGSDNSPWYKAGSGWLVTNSPRHPIAPLRGSDYVAMFNSYDIEDGLSGIIGMKEKVDTTEALSVTVSFYMYHDSEEEDAEYYCDDYIVPYYSLDNRTVSSFNKNKVYRYDGSTGWKKHTCTFTPAPGSYYIGLKGYSDWGYNMYIDEVTITIELEDKTPPTAPKIELDITKLTNKNLVATITDGEDDGVGVSGSEYKIGQNGQWMSYVKPIEITKNTVVYARTIDKAGLVSEEASKNINNIDKTPPKIIAKTNNKVLKNGGKAKKAVSVKITDQNISSKIAAKNGKKISWPKNNKFSKKGKYLITATDKAGNKTKYKFSIV